MTNSKLLQILAIAVLIAVAMVAIHIYSIAGIGAISSLFIGLVLFSIGCLAYTAKKTK